MKSQRKSKFMLGKIVIAILITVLTPHISTSPSCVQWYLIFEYLLPREGGRRPDLVILAEGNIIVLEFKCKEDIRKNDIDQLAGYVRDLANYHQVSQGYPITGALVLTQTRDLVIERDGLWVYSPDKLHKIFSLIQNNGKELISEDWINSSYDPLPTLVEAAKRIFKHEKLPQIKQANSSGIPEAISFFKKIATQAKVKGERHLALVTGVPGAGKTLLGLQFVHDDENIQQDRPGAVFLSGNGPLVKVLQYALGNNKVFVQSLNHYVKDYVISQRDLPLENILVFDEAQRAWDAQRVNYHHGTNTSEPELIIEIAEKIPDWSLVLGLIGEGQEIHLGEEGGLALWNRSLEKAKQKWKLYCPSKVAHHFNAVEIREMNVLNLTTSLRSHIAVDVQNWINALLQGKINEARHIAKKIPIQRFIIYITRELKEAKAYSQNLYAGTMTKRYGLLASSKSTNLERHNIFNQYKDRGKNNLAYGPFYVDPPNSPQSCCTFKYVATEFSCQGLELDLPIICWGDDLTWNGRGWNTSGRANARDPHKLTLNSYRVLLSRGRDGIIIFVPSGAEMDKTYDVLVNAGVRTARASGQS